MVKQIKKSRLLINQSCWLNTPLRSLSLDMLTDAFLAALIKLGMSTSSLLAEVMLDVRLPTPVRELELKLCYSLKGLTQLENVLATPLSEELEKARSFAKLMLLEAWWAKSLTRVESNLKCSTRVRVQQFTAQEAKWIEISIKQTWWKLSLDKRPKKKLAGG